MSHTCKALVIHCIDFRLGKAIKKYLEDQNLLGDADIVSVAGAVKDLDYAMKQIDISKRLHNISEVILINHTDCGAYGGDDSKHETDLETAKRAILAKFPELSVRKMIARLKAGQETSFLEIIGRRI